MEFPWLSLGFNGNHRNWRNLLGFRGISMQNCLKTPITGGHHLSKFHHSASHYEPCVLWSKVGFDT